MVTLLVVLCTVSFFLGMLVYSRGPARQLTITVDELKRAVDRLEVAGVLAARNLAATGASEQRADAARDGMTASLARMEAGDAVVAEGRVLIKDNLADSQDRANATHGDSGAKADAALSSETVAEIHKRQDAET